MAHVILMPKAGQSMTEGRIITWLKNEGDSVGRGEPLLEIETDKANLEVEAIDAGVLRKVFVAADESCLVLCAVGIIGRADEDIDFDALRKEADDAARAAAAAEEGEAKSQTKSSSKRATPKAKTRKAAPRRTPAATPVAAAAKAALTPAAPAAASAAIPSFPVAGMVPAPGLDARGRRIAASPLARKIAAERGVSLARVQGSGPAGRILKRDVESAPNSASPNWAASNGDALPMIAASTAGPLPPAPLPPAEIPLEGMRGAIAKALQQSTSQIPHFYATVSIDMTQALALKAGRAASGQRISVNDLIVRAVSLSLQDEPTVNCRVFDDHIEYPDDVNIGIAVGSDDGLVVPVILRSQDLDLDGIAEETRRIVSSALAGKLIGSGRGTFTISNLGMFGVESFTAIINPPEGAILAVGCTQQVLQPHGGGFFPRSVMQVTLSSDHRAIDGLLAARFLQRLKYFLESAQQL